MIFAVGTRRFASFDETRMPSVSVHKYFRLNPAVFLLISETNLSLDIFLQDFSRILIKCLLVYSHQGQYFRDFINFLILFLPKPEDSTML